MRFTIQSLLIACLLLSLLVSNPDVAAQEPGSDWLSAGERTWLDAHPVLRHGVVTNHEPFEFVDEEGTYNGLTSDYTAIIGERLGIRFEQVRFDNFAALVAGMRDGSIDLATYLPMSQALANVFAWSDPVISMPIAVFGRQDAALLLDLNALEQWRVVVEKPSRAQEILARDWPALQFQFVDSPVEGLAGLVDRDSDYFIHNVFSVEYYQRQLGIAPHKIALQTQYSFDIRFSARPELEPLIPLIHKTINGLSNHERTLIFDKWVNRRPDNNVDWEHVFVVGGAALVVALMLFLWVIFWNRRLTHQVAERTQDLEESHETMRLLALHMDKIREEEKSAIALEMHDELGHSLTALTMSIRRFSSMLRKEHGESDDIAERVRNLLQLVREATSTSRRIMSDLRPSVLNDLGLVAAIEWLAHEFEAHHRIPCWVDAEDLDIDLPDGAPIALFRIVQESLTNVAKHANATLTTICLRIEDTTLKLDIADNGIGIPEERTGKDRSFGLMGMGERALALGGELYLTEGDNGGTLVSVRIPLDTLIHELTGDPAI